jgi:hypothetical protein
MKPVFSSLLFSLISLFCYVNVQAQSNACSTSSTLLTSSTSCSNTAGTLNASTASSPNISSTCTGTPDEDVWYRFVANTVYPEIRLSSINGNNFRNNLKVQLLTSCSGGELLCSASSGNSLTITTTSLNGGAGLTVGTTYYLRLYLPTSANDPSTGATFNICIVDPVATSVVDYSKSYVNITKGTNGGSVEPGDVLEFRATFVVKAPTSGTLPVDSVAFFDTLYNNKGLALVPGTITTRTNEGKVYQTFTDAGWDDAGGYRLNGLDTTIRIAMGTSASALARGVVANTAQPSFYGSTCIVMATYRATVYATYGQKIVWGGGKLTYRDQGTGVITTINFKRDSLIVYSSPGLCPNAVSVTNAVGAEVNGTFGTPAGNAPLARNKTSSISTYSYQPFTIAGSNGGGPSDYHYTVANNTSVQNYTTLNTSFKPNSGTNYRLYGVWDLIGDHTNATDQAKGNSPCDTTKPVDPVTNPCGYMLVVNAAYKTDTAFQYTVTNLCPNTYYELSAWFRNICYRCGCDVTGKGSGDVGYIPFATGDSSGVQPNIAFDINGTDYYTTGNIPYYGTDLVAPRDTTPSQSDNLNRWVKRGFVYLTGPSETSFTLTLRNNAPGGGGNDWAMDDISVATCLPNMSYSPTTNPMICQDRSVEIADTVRSYFNNYNHFKWQRSTNGGTTWTDIAGATGSATPVLVGSLWQYITTYTVPASDAKATNSGDKYRVLVSTTTSGLSNTSCQLTDGVSIITITTYECNLPAKLLSFNGRLVAEHAKLNWTTTEDEEVTFYIEKSLDGSQFTTIGSLPGFNNNASAVNNYSFADSIAVAGKAWYRIVIVNAAGKKTYSRIIALTNSTESFSVVNVINPFTKEVIFDVQVATSGRVDATLINTSGTLLKKQTYAIQKGINSLSMTDMDIYAAGVYFLRIQYKDQVVMRKIIKH